MNTSSPRYPKKSLSVTNLHSNTETEIVEITSDKLRLILTEHIKKSEKASEWQTALAILITAIASLVTTEFRTSFGVDGGVWKALFIIAAVVSFFWLVKAVIRAVRVESIDKLIARIQNQV